MQLPEGTEQRGYLEWNFLVRGMVQVWELARLVGVEQKLEQRLQEDRDGILFELLGRAGNECSDLTRLLVGRLDTKQRDDPAGTSTPVSAPLAAVFGARLREVRAQAVVGGSNGAMHA